VVTQLTYRPPLEWDALLGFLAPRAIPGVEEVRDGCYRRTVMADGRPALLEVEPRPRTCTVEVRLTYADPARVAYRVRRLLDLDAEPEVIDGHLGQDPVLAPMVAARPGLRSPGAFDVFELTVRAILGQQVSVAAATTLSGRLVALAGIPLATPSGGLSHVFPPPANLAAADLGGLGVPGRRAETVRLLSRAVAEGELRLEGDPAAAAALLALPGIGPWTVSYVAMRGMGDADAFPAADLGLHRAAAALGLPDDPGRLTIRAERWRPWRSYAVHHLWRSLGARPAGG
jgi:AraC family transcriptional regulator of adaptative response / DNA-3-methyladenine glycosylase II